MSTQHLLELRNVTKTFPGVKALSDINFEVKQGEIHALMGENGAGKSTMIKIICGVFHADQGEMLFNGQNVKFRNPREAFHSGISVVHQERNLVPTFSVAENIMIDKLSAGDARLIDWKSIYREAQKYLDMVGLKLSPYQNVESLSAGKKQMIEIARALSYDAQLLLLDEPTASISLKEADQLLETIHGLQKQGMTFIYVSHKIEEVFTVADRVTVLRDGKNTAVGTSIRELDRDKLINLMVGRDEDKTAFAPRDMTKEAPVLEVHDLKSKESLKPNSFALHKGEILGLYGLVGAGRTELMRALIGFDSGIHGKVCIDGKPVKIRSVNTALMKHGIVYVSENRQEEGLFQQHDIASNIAVSIWKKLSSRLCVVNRKKERDVAAEYVEKLEVKTPSLEQTVGNLSGGNQQKVCIGKGLATQPRIIIFDEPTVGIDIKTKGEIHNLIWELAQQGKSIIVVSSDLPEVIRLADRILVFRNGSICSEILNDKDYQRNSQQIMDSITKNTAKAEAAV